MRTIAKIAITLFMAGVAAGAMGARLSCAQVRGAVCPLACPAEVPR